MDPRCLEIGKYYNEKDMHRYFSLTFKLISDNYEKKLEAVEEILRDKEVPEKIWGYAYELYEEISNALKLKPKPYKFFRKIPLPETELKPGPVKIGEKVKIVKEEVKKIKEEAPIQVKEEIKPIEKKKKKLLTEEEYLKKKVKAKKSEPGLRERIRIGKAIGKVGEGIEKVGNSVGEYVRRRLERVPRMARLAMAPFTAEIILFGILFGNQYLKINSINNQITYQQELCQDIKEKGQIKKYVKNLRKQTVYLDDLVAVIPDLKDIEPGKYSLSEFFYCKDNQFEGEINAWLDSTKIEVKKRNKPLSTPVKDPRYSSKFGAVYRVIHLPTGGHILRNKPHKGQDYCSPELGVYAAADGKVSKVYWNKGYGLVLDVDHGILNGSKFKTRYAHCSKAIVKKGEEVKRGQLIAIMGATGLASGRHLHFEVRINNAPVNPLKYTERTEAWKEAENNIYLTGLQTILDK